MKQVQCSTKVAGVDVSKRTLDAAVHGSEALTHTANDEAGLVELIDWLRRRGVVRVGLEASGGYERALRTALDAAGFEVVVHQPLEVRLFARLKRLRAKSDRLDAQLIAAATAQVDAVRAASDPLLVELAERLTAYEQIADQAARLKTCREHLTLADLKAGIDAQIGALTRLKRRLAQDMFERIKARPDLRRRWELLQSLPGVGLLIAAVLIVRMPELGAMEHGQAAALLGVAPYDRDSGAFKGQRFTGGGRSRPRRFVYLAALSAKRFDPDLKAFADRLLGSGKAAKLVITAVMRKLIEAANLVLKRQQPWLSHAIR